MTRPTIELVVFIPVQQRYELPLPVDQYLHHAEPHTTSDNVFGLRLYFKGSSEVNERFTFRFIKSGEAVPAGLRLLGLVDAGGSTYRLYQEDV